MGHIDAGWDERCHGHFPDRLLQRVRGGMIRRGVRTKITLRPGVVIDLGEALLDARPLLGRHLATNESFAVLLKRHGWRANPDEIDMERARPVFASMGDPGAVGRLAREARETGQAGRARLAAAMLDALQAIPAAIAHLGREARRAGGFPFGSPAFWDEFPRELLDELIVDHFALNRPQEYAPLVLGDLFAEEIVDVRGAGGRDNYSCRRIDWARLREATTPPPA